MAVAKIIVDVPLMQTDQPYSYRIPEDLRECWKLGCGSMCPLVRGIA